MDPGRMVKGEICPNRPAGQATDSNRLARREMDRQIRREQKQAPWRRVARNGFGSDY